MNSAIRYAVLDMVAGMRGEKRAAPAWLGRAAGRLRRGWQLLSGSQARSLGNAKTVAAHEALAAKQRATEALSAMQAAARSRRPADEIRALFDEAMMRKDTWQGTARNYISAARALTAEQQAVERFRNAVAGYGALSIPAAYGGYRLFKPSPLGGQQQEAQT